MAKNNRFARREDAKQAPIVEQPKTSMLPPLPSEVVAEEEAKTGVQLTDEERLAAIAAAADLPPTIPIVTVPESAAAEVPKAVIGRRVRYNTDDLIVVRKTNPKRPGTAGYDRYAVYQTGMVVSDYMASKVVGKFARADLAWDLDRGFISIVPRSEFAAAVADGPVVGADHAVAVAESQEPQAAAEEVAPAHASANSPSEDAEG